MFMPLSIVKMQNFSKANRHTKMKRIFKDKVVNGNRSPLLYNIEVGREHLQRVAGSRRPDAPVAKTTQDNITPPTSYDRGYLAREMMTEMGVAIDPTRKKKHSLVAEEASKMPLLANPNLVDWGTLNNSKIRAVSAEYAFKDSKDPFYAVTLDQLNEYRPRKKYTKESDPRGKPVHIPDVSKFASRFTIMNLSNLSFGKTKYFHDVPNYRKV